jgi:hypothetical protein
MSFAPRAPFRHRYPNIPDTPLAQGDTLSRIVSAIRERLDVYSGNRGRIEDSLVSVQDLLDMRLITLADLDALERARK